MIFGFSADQVMQLLANGLILPFLVVVLFWKNNKDQESYKKESQARETRQIEESKLREEKLMNQLDKYNCSLERITLTNEKFDLRLSNMENKLERKERQYD